MSDIVERLRTLITYARDSGMKTETLEDAKREIERLRDALRTIRFEIDSQCGPLTVDTIDPANPMPGDPPIQQQPNSAVFPGFRGNNEA